VIERAQYSSGDDDVRRAGDNETKRIKLCGLVGFVVLKKQKAPS
jgi:hypothetical protein